MLNLMLASERWLSFPDTNCITPWFVLIITLMHNGGTIKYHKLAVACFHGDNTPPLPERGVSHRTGNSRVWTMHTETGL